MLCGASAYEQKYYFNQDFSSLPDAVKQEAQFLVDSLAEAVAFMMRMPEEKR